MRNLLVVALSLPLVACLVGTDPAGPGPGDDDGSGSGSGSGSGEAGHITADETWTGPVAIDTNTTIDPGVTVTVMPGATVTFASGVGLAVKGTLDVQGTSASKVTIESAAGQYFSGITVGGAPEMVGVVNMAYAVQRGGKITTLAGAQVTISDTKMFDVSGDFLVMNGGTVNVTYSQIGADVGTIDGTHCNLHFGGNGNTISITRSNIIGTPYALMFYSGTNAIFTNNNWDKGATGVGDWVDSSPGVMGDFTGSFFAAGPPSPKAGATFIGLDALAPARIIDAGVRP